MFCTNCGERLEAGGRFCTQCGVKLDADVPAPPALQTAARRADKVPAGAVAGIVSTAAFAVVLIAAFTLSNEAAPSRTEKVGLTASQHRELVTKLQNRMSEKQLNALMDSLGVNEPTKAFIQQCTTQRDWEAQLNVIAGFSRDYHVLAGRTPPPSPAPAPSPVRPVYNSSGQVIPVVMRGTRAADLKYISYSNFKNYAHYPVKSFLAANGWDITSQRTYAELPESVKNKVREIGDYLHAHYTYGTRKTYNGMGQDDDAVFDCDDFAALMYRMGRKAGLEMYIIGLPGHWANAVRYGRTLYTIEPQGYDVKYNREAAQFGVTNGEVTDREKLKAAYERACARCDHEYTLHWTRTAYFWGIIAAMFAGYISVMTSDNYKNAVCMHIDLYLLLLGFVFSSAWLMVIKGSTYWHENWEEHIRRLGEYISGGIDKTIYCTNKVVFSPNRINKMLAVITIGVWALLLVQYFASRKAELNDWRVMLPVALAIAALLLIYFIGRSGGYGMYKTDIPEDEKGAFIDMDE